MQGKKLVDIAQAWVLLRLKEENRVTHHFGFCRSELVDHIGVNFARPRPATDIRNTLVVNRDDGDLVVRIF